MPNKSFWTTLPGILTGIAAIGTAVAGVIVALTQAGFFNNQNGSAIVTPGPSVPAHPGPVINHSPEGPGPVAVYPRDVSITGSATAGEYSFKILSARLEEYGQDPLSQAKMLLLRLRIRETFNAKFGTGYFMPDGFRLVIDDVVKSPKESPIQNIDQGTSQDGEVTFLLPEDAKQVSLRVGYYDGQRSEIPLTLFPSPRS